MQNILKAQNSGGNENIVPFKKASDKLELPFKAIIKIGTMVIFWEKSSEEVWDLSVDEINKRFYKVTGLSEQVIQGNYFYAAIVLRHNMEARSSTDLKLQDGVFNNDEDYMALRKMNHN